jgi:hypothetical protein
MEFVFVKDGKSYDCSNPESVSLETRSVIQASFIAFWGKYIDEQQSKLIGPLRGISDGAANVFHAALLLRRIIKGDQEFEDHGRETQRLKKFKCTYQCDCGMYSSHLLITVFEGNEQVIQVSYHNVSGNKYHEAFPQENSSRADEFVKAVHDFVSHVRTDEECIVRHFGINKPTLAAFPEYFKQFS